MADLIEVRDLSIEFDNRGTMVPALDRISFRIRAGLDGGAGRRIRLRQVGHRQAIMGILPKTARITSGEILFSAPGSTQAAGRHHAARARRRGDPRDPRPPHLDHLPGADDLAVAAAHDRRPGRARRCSCTARSAHAEGMRADRGDAARWSAFPNPARALRHLSVRAVRRPAPARDDRDGAGLPAGAADRRRADHGARRDDPGADPEADQGAAGRARHGGAADHPRPRRRRQHRRGGRRDVPRPGDGERHARRHLPAARAIPICRRCCARCRAST